MMSIGVLRRESSTRTPPRIVLWSSEMAPNADRPS